METKQFNELIQMEINELSNEQLKFIENHNLIIRFANNSIEQLMLMAEALECMRDSKYYTYAGFDTFKDYVENALGIKERQAYNYIKVYQKFSKEFLHSNAKLGISKLTLLSTVSNDHRDELLETVNVEEVSVRELKEKIKELQNSNKVLEENLEQLNMNFNFNERVIHDGAVYDLELEKEALLKEIESLKKQQPKEIIKEVIIESEDLLEIKQQLEEKESQLHSLNFEIESLRKELKTSDKDLMEFKILFNDFQRILNSMFESLNKLENKTACKNAIITVLKEYELYE